MRPTLALLLALAACRAPEVAEAGEGSSSGGPTSGGPTTGEVDGCADVACGDGASCDPHDGRCYCDPGRHGEPRTACSPHPDRCADAAARVGHSVCRHELPDDAAWTALSVGASGQKGLRRIGKYLAPLHAAAPLPTLFADVNHYSLHLCLLQEAFPDVLPGFTHQDYLALVWRRATRTMAAGSVYELADPDAPARFVFTVETPDDPGELLREDEVYGVYHLLRDRLGAGTLGFLPMTAAQQGFALSWKDPGMPVVFDVGAASINYEVYTPGVTYGRVRRYAADEVPHIAGKFGWQDILVLETAPLDLTGVMAGVITGARQDLLSHLNVLSSRRGTPNAYVADPLAAFAEYDGQLVQLRAEADRYRVTLADLADAEAFWAAHRPMVPVDHPPDPDFEKLIDVRDIPVATAEERGAAVGRFGGKVTGLATLYDVLDPAHQAQGFGIPVAHYLRFMDENTWEVFVDGAPQTLSFAATVDRWLDDPAFRSDPAVREAWLSALESAIRHQGVLAPDVRAAIAAQIEGVFGDPAAMVRFRSSSNVEDGVEFNGAGLYASESGCALDLPGDDGESACDPGAKARPLDAAVKAVWASLWRFGAFEEREYYQIDHRRAAMGILVSTRYDVERANGVAFTGNPLAAKDDRYAVNVQLGDVDVVDAPPGVVAELDYLTVSSGEVTAIERATPSSLVPAGARVLSDDQLRELGAVMAAVAAVYPVDPGDHDPADVLLDLEFKVVDDDRLVFKQVRPFLRGAVDPALPGCM
jgi:hypothetical protein